MADYFAPLFTVELDAAPEATAPVSTNPRIPEGAVNAPDMFPPHQLTNTHGGKRHGTKLGNVLPNQLAETTLQHQPICKASAQMQDVSASAFTWPSLIELDAPDLPHLNRSVLPSWAGDFAAALADATETPVELAASMVLAGCSAAAARRFHIMVKPDYFEPLATWFACALPPGNRKSAVQGAATAPLLSWEKDEADRLHDEIKAATSALRTAEARAKELRAKAARATDELDCKDLAAQAASIEADLPEVPRVHQLWTSDVTPEKLGEILADNSERMAWLSSEGGLFDMMGGRYSNGVPNLDLFLKSHSGDADRVDRTSRGPVFLRNPLLTIGVSPQPDVLRGLGSKPGFRGRGLLGRFLYLLPPSPLGYRNLDAPPIPKQIKQSYAAGVRAILDVPQAIGDGEEQLHALRLSPEAYDEWRDFALHMEATMRPGSEFEHAKDWAGKAPGAAARLAGVLHVMETVMTNGWGQEVSINTMSRALELMAVIAKHSRHVLDLMGADEGIGAARRVWEWIRDGRRSNFTVRDAFQALKGSFPRVATVDAALKILEERGYLTVIDPPIRGPGRPPSPTVIVRPDIAEGWR
ncbi:MAG TPA: YfjI family protein [Azospirillum sp.]|nr:YfjI family protein [Azospirillum sp.]